MTLISCDLSERKENTINSITDFESIVKRIKKRYQDNSSISKFLQCFGAYPSRDTFQAFFIYNQSDYQSDFQIDDLFQLLFRSIHVTLFQSSLFDKLQ